MVISQLVGAQSCINFLWVQFSAFNTQFIMFIYLTGILRFFLM